MNGADLRENFVHLARTTRRARTIDVVVSDIHMPGTTALEVLAEFRQLADEIPIVLITAFGSAETHDRARSLGAVAVIDKPFDIGALRRTVATLVPAPARG